MSNQISFGRKVIILGADMSSCIHVDNTKKDISIFVEGPTQGLVDRNLTSGKNCSINFTEFNEKFCISLHHYGANSYLFVNGVKIHKLKLKISEFVAAPLCLGNISKTFSIDNMKNTGFYRDFFGFSVLLWCFFSCRYARHSQVFNEKHGKV